jgi:hypothetical protein
VPSKRWHKYDSDGQLAQSCLSRNYFLRNRLSALALFSGISDAHTDTRQARTIPVAQNPQ